MVIVSGQLAVGATEPEEAGNSPVQEARSKKDAERIAFFENKIRPALVEHCIECHNGDAAAPDGGLVLDRAEGWRIGGDSGPAIVPGDSDDSLLMSAIRYESIEMPPDGRLPAETIADFKRWIDDGAVDPRDGGMPTEERRAEIDWSSARQFWSFRPPRLGQPPTVVTTDRGHDAVDSFLFSRLDAEGLEAAPPADPLTRLRRLSFDLTGLPPSPELIEAFLADPSETHFRRIVDRQLHSPAYAEHWARHWLDVARYADSNGSDFNATFHDAWRYRDYVVRSFAEDKPFDRFVVQQIAGDLLSDDDPSEAADNLVATGFLMLGTKMLSERDKAKLEMDVVDDMIDTVGRAFLGLTLGCARCHDHKFDPIPTEDYYALAGIFRSTQVLDGESQKYVSTWHKRPLPVAAEQAAAVADYESQRKRLTAALNAAKKGVEAAEAILPSTAGLVVDDSQATREGEWQATTYSSPFHGKGYVHDGNRNKGQARITFAGPATAGDYEVRIAYTAGGNRASNVPVTLHLGRRDDSGSAAVRQEVVDQRQQPAISPYWHSLGEYRFGDDGTAKLVISNEATDGYVLADAVQYLKVGDVAEESEADRIANRERELAISEANRVLEQAQQAVDDLERDKPAPLPLAMAVRDAARIGDTFVCVRGEVANRGPEVPRGFLRICSTDGTGNSVEIPADESGRLQLAHWITDPDHPLTARVIVNRVWMHLFGEGLVRTVDNFGFQGERPSHPELLDRLAVEFVRDGWSIRRLVRRLVLTEAYGRSSRFDQQAFDADPDNRWLWRASRRRLTAESMRDTLLVAAGQLDPTPSVAPMSGFGTLVSQNVATPSEVKVSQTPRRSVYLPVIRGQLPSLLVTFDFADPDLIVGRRDSTNVPTQGLTLLNNPEVVQWCGEIAQRLLTAHDEDAARLRMAYRLLLQRDPTETERQWVLDFVGPATEQADESHAQRWTLAVQTLVASTEFRFLD